MKEINVQSIKEYGQYIEFVEGVGYIYKAGDEFFSINKDGVKKIIY